MRKGVYLIGAVVLGTIALTWLVWHQTWFGVRLADSELIDAMAPSARPREVQHGIEEITHRLAEAKPGTDRWARLLVDASRRAEEPVRVTAAWGMGYGDRREEFVLRLREMTDADPSVMVRRNAASSLARAGDPAGRAVLRSMLDAYTVTSPAAGVVSGLAAVDVPVRETTAVARVTKADGTVVAAEAGVPGRVLRRAAEEGARVAAGDALVVLGPDAAHALNGASGLALVGTKEDLEILGVAAAPQSGLGEDVKAAARTAMEWIRARGK